MYHFLLLLTQDAGTINLAQLQTVRQPTFQYTYIAPKSDFSFFLTHNYLIKLPLKLDINHAGFTGSWTLASVGDVRAQDHQIPLIQELESGIVDGGFCKVPFTDNRDEYCGTLFCTIDSATITKIISRKLAPAFTLQSEDPIACGIFSDVQGFWF